MSTNIRVFPLPLYIQLKDRDVNDGAGLHMEKLTPMRIFGKLFEFHEDETISFRWANDNRDLETYQDLLDKHYAKQDVLENATLEEGVTYVIHHDDHFYRCQLSNITVTEKIIVNLIDMGKSVEVKTADFYYFQHDESWNNELYHFAFAGVCRLADKNQCLQLGLPSADQFSPGEEVEIFLLSSQEPYYAVISSLRNPEAKVLESTLTGDLLLPEFADAWDDVAGNYFDLTPAERPTLSLSPKWIHGLSPVLVTIPYIEALEKIVVCDLLCSLRACILAEYLRENYQKQNVQQSLAISDPVSQIGIGVIVVALDTENNRYYRARITEVNASFSFVDLVGIDFPQWKSFNHSLHCVWLLSKTLEILPRMHHYVPLQRGITYASNIKLLMNELAGICCKPYAVALLQHNDDTLEPEIIVPDRNNKKHNLFDLLPYEKSNAPSRSQSIISLATNDPRKLLKTWKNKSKFSKSAFRRKEKPEEEKVTTATVDKGDTNVIDI